MILWKWLKLPSDVAIVDGRRSRYLASIRFDGSDYIVERLVWDGFWKGWVISSVARMKYPAAKKRGVFRPLSPADILDFIKYNWS
jgi:hypothetical protein